MGKEGGLKIIRTATVPFSLEVLLKGQLNYLNKNGFEVIGVSSSGIELDKVQKREGVRTVPVEMERQINVLKDLSALWKLYSLFKKEQPEIVHAITPKAGLLSMMAAKLAGVPVRMHTFTGLIWPTRTGFMRKLLMKMDQLLCWAATDINPEGQGVKEDLIEHKITKKPLKVIGNGNVNGIDTAEFDPKRISLEKRQALRGQLGIKEDDFVFLFVGRVVTDKGIGELVDAFNQLNPHTANRKPPTDTRHPPTPHLVIVGDYEKDLDPLPPETEQTIQEHPYIHAVGYKTNVVAYFGLADVLTFPSYREGFPNVVMQAAAMQLNAIVTDINGSNEIITDGKNGWIIPSKNVDKLKERMEWCLKNKETSKKMGLKSRKLMQEKYERSFVWQEILKEYRRLVG